MHGERLGVRGSGRAYFYAARGDEGFDEVVGFVGSEDTRGAEKAGRLPILHVFRSFVTCAHAIAVIAHKHLE